MPSFVVNHIISDSQEVVWESSPLADNEDAKQKVFVEANLDVPVNIPDSTNIFSFRDQQAAQEYLPDEKSANFLPSTPKAMPAQSIKNFTTTEIPQLVPPSASGKKQSQNFTQNQAHDIDPTEVVGKGGGFNAPNQAQLKNRHIDLRSGPTSQIKTGSGSTDSVTHNKTLQLPRPKISQSVLPFPVLQNKLNAPRKGKIAIDSRLNPYGLYLQKMMKSIEGQWYSLLAESIPYLASLPTPQVFIWKFKLSTNGQISELKIVRHPLMDELAAEFCRQAIASRAPCGMWSDEMIEEFGQSDQITIRFEYY